MVKQATVFQSAPSWPDAGGRPALNKARLSAEEASLVAGYFEAGAVVMHTAARGIDVLGDDAAVVPMTIRTDGEYAWTGPVTYYVRTHAVAPGRVVLGARRCKIFPDAVAEHGDLPYDESFIFVPLLPLGGEAKASNLHRRQTLTAIQMTVDLHGVVGH